MADSLAGDRTGLPEDYFRRPTAAGVWSYWLGGEDHHPADRVIGDAVIEVNPGVPAMARQCRQFLGRAVRYLAGEVGIRQFLDIGTGLPADQNTHEHAQAVAPDARVVYVDNDPLVLTYARAWLTSATTKGSTCYLRADARDPAELIAGAKPMLDFDQPVAVMLLGILGHVARDFDTMRDIVNELMAAVAPGSYLILVDGVDIDPVFRAGVARQTELGHPYYLRSPQQFIDCLKGLDLVEPGLVPVNQWRPETPDDAAGHNDAYGAVASKP
jgi:SAM-dependent methyltransferase